MQDKYREQVMQMAPKAKEFGKQLAEGGGSQIVPTLHPEKWDQYCTELQTIKTCIGACNDASDAAMKVKAEAVLNAVKDIVCDTEIKVKFPCLQEVTKTPSPTCDTQCQPFKQPLVDAYTAYGAAPPGPPDMEKVKTAGKNVCLLVNCRLKCRKADIEQKCQADGYAAAKKLVKELAVLGKTAHAQFRPPGNFPDECNPDAVVAGA